MEADAMVWVTEDATTISGHFRRLGVIGSECRVTVALHMLAEMARGSGVATALDWAVLSPVFWLLIGGLLLGMGLPYVGGEALLVVGAMGTLVAEIFVAGFWHRFNGGI